MAFITIVVGLLLTALGAVTYVLSGAPTSLIPAFFGIVLLILGFLARADSLRKHAMHAASAVALIGFLGAITSLLRAPMATRSAMANASQVTMAIVTAIFVVLCIKSF